MIFGAAIVYAAGLFGAGFAPLVAQATPPVTQRVGFGKLSWPD